MPDLSTWWSSPEGPEDGFTLPASPVELQATSGESSTVAPLQLDIPGQKRIEQRWCKFFNEIPIHI